MNKKLIVAHLGGNAAIEQHNLFIGVAESFTDPKLIEELKLFWPQGTHLDDGVFLTEINAYDVKVVTLEQAKKSELKLYIIFLGFYKVLPQLPTVGLHLTSLEGHAIASVIVKDESEIKNILLTIPDYKEGQEQAPGVRSHIDNQYGVIASGIDAIFDMNIELGKKGYALEIVKKPEALSSNSEVWHGYGKFSKVLKEQEKIKAE